MEFAARGQQRVGPPPRKLWGGAAWRSRTDRRTSPGWGVWLLRQGPVGGTAAPRPPVPWPLRLLLEMLFLSVSCFSVRVARPPQRRSHPGEEEGAGPSRTVWPGEGRARGSWPAALWSPPPFGNVDPRLRSMFQFHAGSWESWCCCCCLIPGDRPWDRGRRWRLEMADTRSVHETRFEAAVKVIQSLPKNGTCTWAPLKKPPAEARGPRFLNPTSLNLLSASGLAYLTYLFSSLISACS